MANKRNADNPITEEQAKPQKETEAKSIITKKPRQPEVLDRVAEKYRLKALMNVRKKPSTEASILDTRAEGTIVRVLRIEKDWLCLADGSYILYENGKWAEKI
ncbi:MAG: SH3 domain-containing protein [Blautia sp.]|nr:SH3 domain-containing protein [Blautia sp.]